MAAHTPKLDTVRAALSSATHKLNRLELAHLQILRMVDKADGTENAAAEELLGLLEEQVEALNILVGYVWHLLESQNLVREGAYAFPNGDIWDKEELQQWKTTFGS